jgi:hypothetical protein
MAGPLIGTLLDFIQNLNFHLLGLLKAGMVGHFKSALLKKKKKNNCVRILDLPQIVFGGGRGIIRLPFFLQSSLPVRSFHFSILAKSATVSLTTPALPSGPGYVLQLDHFNEQTRLNEFRVLACKTVKQHDNYCTEIYKKNVFIKRLMFNSHSQNGIGNPFGRRGKMEAFQI